MSVLSDLFEQAKSLAHSVENDVEQFVSANKGEVLAKAQWLVAQLEAEVNTVEGQAATEAPTGTPASEAPAAPAETATPEAPAETETPAEDAVEGSEEPAAPAAPEAPADSGAGVQTSSDLNG